MTMTNSFNCKHRLASSKSDIPYGKDLIRSWCKGAAYSHTSWQDQIPAFISITQLFGSTPNHLKSRAMKRKRALWELFPQVSLVLGFCSKLALTNFIPVPSQIFRFLDTITGNSNAFDSWSQLPVISVYTEHGQVWKMVCILAQSFEPNPRQQSYQKVGHLRAKHRVCTRWHVIVCVYLNSERLDWLRYQHEKLWLWQLLLKLRLFSV